MNAKYKYSIEIKEDAYHIRRLVKKGRKFEVDYPAGLKIVKNKKLLMVDILKLFEGVEG